MSDSATPTPNRSGLHPMLWVAASAVTVFALAGTAYVTGLLPRHDTPATPPAQATASTETAPVQQAPAALPSQPTTQPGIAKKVEPVAPRPANRDNSREYSSREARPQYSQYGSRDDAAMRVDNGRSYGTQPSYSAPPPVCRECGTVESVRAVTREGEGSGLGAVAGGVVGGALGNGVGQGTGRDLATIAGAIGGAVLGNKIEKNQRQTVSYQTTIRYEDGSSQTFTSDRETAWRPGDRVKVINGQIIPR